MKMSKLQFKSMLKECLSELINEGAFDNKIEQITEGKMRKTGMLSTASIYGNSHVNASASDNSIPPHLLQAVRNLSEGSTALGGVSKGMFAELLLDTATHTLQKQIREDRGTSANMLMEGTGVSEEESAADTNQLEMLAGGDISRWAKSAFNKKP